MRFSLMFLLFAIQLESWAVEDLERQQIENRIKPIGQVHLEEQRVPEVKAPSSTTQANAAVKKGTGQETYEQYCITCHRDGLAGAPKFRVAADWQPRFDQKKLDGLVESAVKGLNAMPAKGTCTECSETDIKEAINYMLPQS